MEIIEYYNISDQEYWLEQIKKSDWGAGSYLYELLRADRLKKLCGADTKVFLLVEGERLISFCTFAEQDDVRAQELHPWVGFVYTFPQYRGKRRMGKLLERAYREARRNGAEYLYISTGETGLYEKYGYEFWRMMKDVNGEDSRIYRIAVRSMDYGQVIGTVVKGKVDRPAGSAHPRHPEMIYPVNYGYVDGVLAGDGAEQDVYVLGTDVPLTEFTGRVIAVYHRLNDVEDKWIVSVDSAEYSAEEILKKIEFQEQYYVGELYGNFKG